MDSPAGTQGTSVGELQQMLSAAMAHHQAGSLAEAEALYQRVLAAMPNQPDALHLLGVLWHQTNRSAQGLELIDRSVSIAPNFASLNNLGDVLRSAGRVRDAIVCFNRSIQMKSDAADPYSNMALALLDLGQMKEAEKYLTRASQLAPNRVDLLLRLCLVRHTLGDPHGAVLAGQRAAELAPQASESWSNLGLALASANKFDQAFQALNRALELTPQRAEVHHNLGYAYSRAGKIAEAEAAYKKALEINPSFVGAQRNLAALYDESNNIPASIEALNRSLEMWPQDLEGWTNLSSLLRRSKDYEGAVRAADRALQINPSHPNGHGNRGLAMLSTGEYEKGFADYEWRWQCDDFSTPKRDFTQPMWDGSDPKGRKIFVHSEQGYGDILQFSRYIPMLEARGATVYFEVLLQLRTLMQSLKGNIKIVLGGTKAPDFDLHVPLLSLPRIFKTTFQSIPAQVPYLSVDPVKLDQWKQKISTIDGRKKVGLIWAGNVKPDASRTCPLAQLAPLGSVDGVTFVSLQKREGPHSNDTPPAGFRMVDVAGDLKDFGDTAAAMLNLDLVLTIDTAASHLAGAIGKNAWVMLPWAADWRWLDNRSDSPWYPTLRLFRQPTRGDWPAVAAQLEQALREWAAG